MIKKRYNIEFNMTKNVLIINNTKKTDGKKSIKKVQKIVYGGCLIHPGCIWYTPCDCFNCINFKFTDLN